MFCRHCGQEINDEAVICVHCGRAVAPFHEKSPQTVAPKNVYNHVTAGLLALFLGSFGAHKFYLKGYGMGVLFLLFFWTGVPFFVSIIEAILYFACPQEKFSEKFGYK